MTEIDSTHSYDLLYFDTCKIIEEARDYAYRAVNVALTLRNWLLGERIARESLDGAERAEYGKKSSQSFHKILLTNTVKGLIKAPYIGISSFTESFQTLWPQCGHNCK